MGDVKKIRPHTGGSPKTFKDDNDFCEWFYRYIEDIFNGGFESVPSFIGFSKFRGCASKTIYRYLDKSPGVRKMIADAFADCLSVGSMTGAYKGNMPIFELKNRAGWTDKHETTSITAAKVATEEEAKEKLQNAIKRMQIAE